MEVKYERTIVDKCESQDGESMLLRLLWRRTINVLMRFHRCLCNTVTQRIMRSNADTDEKYKWLEICTYMDLSLMHDVSV